MALSPTANQAARPNPAYSNARHATERGRADKATNSPRRFLAGKGIPTSGGRAEDGQGTLDRTHDQAGKRLYLGKAYENAGRAKPVATKGNSVGRQELLPNHASNTVVKKAANQRLVSRDDRETQAAGSMQRFTGQPFRRSSPAFGPLGKRSSSARDHNEQQVARGF
jgi:hypothetical protein